MKQILSVAVEIHNEPIVLVAVLYRLIANIRIIYL